MPRRLPVRTQAELADCGPACLAIVLEFHGRSVPLSVLLDLAGSSRDCVSLATLSKAAGLPHMDRRGVKRPL